MNVNLDPVALLPILPPIVIKLTKEEAKIIKSDLGDLDPARMNDETAAFNKSLGDILLELESVKNTKIRL